MKLEGKKGIVTGASSGIGLALTKKLVAKGATVLAISRSVESSALIASDRLHLKNADLSDMRSVDAVFRVAEEKFGRVDFFIANAGFAYYETFDAPDEARIDRIMNTNMKSVIYAAGKMRADYGDQPFNFLVTLSAVSFVSMPGYALYSATKAALRGFVDALRLEVKPNQVIQAVYPVATETNFFNRAHQKRKPWPVQSTDRVVKAIVQGLKKDKAAIYPSKLFKWSYRLTPWFYTLYVRREQKFFQRTMQSNNNNRRL